LAGARADSTFAPPLVARAFVFQIFPLLHLRRKRFFERRGCLLHGPPWPIALYAGTVREKSALFAREQMREFRRITMRLTPTIRVDRLSTGLFAALMGLSLFPRGAAAQGAPSGVMKQDSATSGKADVASEGFATAVKRVDANDITEAKIQAGGLSASGNSRSLALTSMGTVRTRRGANELSAAAAANYGRSASKPEEPMQTTIENYQGKLRYDRFVSDPLALFSSLSGRRDRFQGLDLRLNLDPGLAYYFVQNPKHQLWGELGYDLQYDIRRDEAIVAALAAGTLLVKAKSRHSARLFAGYRNSLNEAVTFDTGVEYLQGLPDTEYWRFNWDIGLTAALAAKFSLATTFSLRYDNHPLTGIKSTDTLTALNLVYQLL
jgi:putative salt-induced outer membrane protein YdiY